MEIELQNIKIIENIHPKLLTAWWGKIQVSFIVFLAQYFQNTVILAKNPLNPTHLIQCFELCVTVILNISVLQLK